MAQKKAHEVDSFIRRPDPRYRAVLIYGPDRGLVFERASALSKTAGVDLSDAFNVVKLESQDVKDDPARLLDEINSMALFGGNRLVWLKNAGNDKTIVGALEAISSDPPQDTLLIVEAGDLKKGSALRKAAESGSSCMALPCYGDDGRNLQALIDEELGQAKLQITPDARRLLADNLGGDRLASRGELQKLALYCRGREKIEESDILAIIGDASALSVDEAVDCVLNGNLSGLDHALTRIIASKTQVFLVLQSCLRQFQTIDVVRGRIEGQRQQASQVIAEYARRMHFRRKPAFETAARNWDGRAVADVLKHLSGAILEGRKHPALQESIARQALLAIALRSARLTR
jgi:DNA polymerase-3 subunit delta